MVGRFLYAAVAMLRGRAEKMAVNTFWKGRKMSDTNNGWPDKPGVPMNPGLPGAHWLKGYTEDAWMYDGDGGWWGPGYSHNLDAGTVAARYSYLGPVLTPAEVAALQKRADQSALGYAREARRADLCKFLRTRDVAALQARIAELEAALKDMAKHVWRGDWDKLKPETRALLDEKK